MLFACHSILKSCGVKGFGIGVSAAPVVRAWTWVPVAPVLKIAHGPAATSPKPMCCWGVGLNVARKASTSPGTPARAATTRAPLTHRAPPTGWAVPPADHGTAVSPAGSALPSNVNGGTSASCAVPPDRTTWSSAAPARSLSTIVAARAGAAAAAQAAATASPAASCRRALIASAAGARVPGSRSSGDCRPRRAR
jgi:hypothetical protein